MHILEFVESLKDEITHSDIVAREKGLLKLTDYLSKLSYNECSSESIDCLVEFYINISSIHYDILPTILKGLLIMVDFIHFSDSNAKRIAAEIVKFDVAQQNPTTRLKIYELLHQLLTYHLQALKSLNKKFLLNFINAVDGESSPNCVLMVLKLNKIIAENFVIDEVYEEYFESISIYFPIEFKANKCTSAQLTRETLVEINKQCMVASPLFGLLLFPILLEKISSEKKSARLDSLDIFADAVDKMHFNDVLSYFISFLELMFFEYKNRDADSQKLVLKCLDQLSRVFQEKANEKELLEYCWELFDKSSGILDDSNTKSLQFLQAGIGARPRIWCGIMGYILPPLMEKAMKQNLENAQQLNVAASLLSIKVDWPKFRGIINNSQTKAFFTQLNILFNNLDKFTQNTDNKDRFVNIFRLLCQFSLFDAWIPNCGEEIHFVTDPKIVDQARCQLVSKAMVIAIAEDDFSLKESLLSMVPLMLQSSQRLSGLKNDLINLIVASVDSQKNLRQFSFKLLSSVPVQYLDIVLNVIEAKLNTGQDFEMATLCLYKIVVKFQGDPEITYELYTFIKSQLPSFIDQQWSLGDDVITNVALILADIGDPKPESLKGDVIEMLWNCTGNKDLSQPCINWLCTLLGQSSIQTISNSVKISSLINWYFFAIMSTGTSQLKSMLYQNYASVINKNDKKELVEKDFNYHLMYLDGDVCFLLWNLKASMLGHRVEITNRLISILMDKTQLSGNLGRDLLNNIEILFVDTDKNHFVSDAQLFVHRSPFYEQQSYQLICQSFQRLANDASNDERVKELCMELYLKMIANYSKNVINLYMEEIATTVSHWFLKLTSIPDRLCLTIGALKAICNLSFTDEILLKYDENIAQKITVVSKSVSSLDLKDRLFLAKVIGWFVTTFPNYDTVKYKDAFKNSLNVLRRDKKRIIRLEAAKSNMIMFCQ